MKTQLNFLITAITILVISINTIAQTNVSGGIYANTNWTLANSPYIATDTVVVFPGVTLTIDPGVTVKFANNKRLEIRQGKLIAAGTPIAPITFTSNSGFPTMGIYTGIFINGGTLVSTFDYCNFRYASIGLNSNTTYTMSIKNSNIEFNTTGFQCVNIDVDSCLFRNNNTAINGGGNVSNSRILQNASGLTYINNVINCIADSNQLGIFHAYGRISGCSINYNTTGLQMCGTIDGCSIKHNQTGVLAKADSIMNSIIDSNSVSGIQQDPGEYDMINTIHNCQIRYNGDGIKQFGFDFITKNTIENNTINGIEIIPNPIMPGMTMHLENIHCNKICNNAGYDLKYKGVNNGTVANNYWCTADSASTSALIYDGYDASSYGLLSIMPVDTINCVNTTGIAIYKVDKDLFQLFPNPAVDYLTIESSSRLSNSKLKITNILGELEFSTLITKQKTEIDISFLSNGIYFIQIAGGGNNLIQKFVKQ